VINALTIRDSDDPHEDRIRLRDTCPFHRTPPVPGAEEIPVQQGRRRAARRWIRAGIAAWLDGAPDVVSFAKNYLAVGFKLEYVKANGDLSHYVPDFVVKTTDDTIWTVETKARGTGFAPEDGPPQAVVRRRDCRQPGRGRAGLPFCLRRRGRLRLTQTTRLRRPLCRLQELSGLRRQAVWNNIATIQIPSGGSVMSTLVIKNFPEDLHARLKTQARQHHRSVTKEVVNLIEAKWRRPASPKAVATAEVGRGYRPTIEDIEAAIAEGRD
jgi:plasmid stability protein